MYSYINESPISCLNIFTVDNPWVTFMPQWNNIINHFNVHLNCIHVHFLKVLVSCYVIFVTSSCHWYFDSKWCYACQTAPAYPFEIVKSTQFYVSHATVPTISFDCERAVFWLTFYAMWMRIANKKKIKSFVEEQSLPFCKNKSLYYVIPNCNRKPLKIIQSYTTRTEGGFKCCFRRDVITHPCHKFNGD